MNVLIVGKGGREHALAWKIMQSSGCDRLLAAPGNPGMAADGAELFAIPVDDISGIVDCAKAQNTGLVVIGPEAPLAAGLGDAVREAGIPCFGPTREGARIESDKAYAKTLMHNVSVPTAEARIFEDFESARNYVLSRDNGVAVKASGLAAGKGVFVCREPYQAVKPLEDIMKDRIFGDAGNTVLIEELLVGPEVTVLALCDGKSIYPLEPLQDHKPVGEGDTGPNTGGMGAYSPVPIVGDAEMEKIEGEILIPIVDAMRRDFGRYEGILYSGLMFTPAGPKVLEFNCRFGDPECQPLVMRIKSDLLEALLATAEHRLKDVTIEWDSRVAVCVVMCSEGYPSDYEKGRAITGIERADAMEGVKVFHAGTALRDGALVTDGGRVLGVTALGDTVAEARRKVSVAVEEIHFDGAFWRRDIAESAC